jgi:hypothetical protein
MWAAKQLIRWPAAMQLLLLPQLLFLRVGEGHSCDAPTMPADRYIIILYFMCNCAVQ